MPAGKALKLEALQDFTDDKDVPRIAGDEWQIEGPCTYFPRPEVKSSGRVDSVVVSYMEALHLRAKRDLVDKTGNKRVTGMYRRGDISCLIKGGFSLQGWYNWINVWKLLDCQGFVWI